MIRYVALALSAHARGGRALFLLAVAGIALGVGSVLSIQILDASALGAFAGSVRAISGDAQLTVMGRGPALDDALLPRVLAEPGVRSAYPVERVEVVAAGPGGAPETLDVLGTDLFAPVRMPWARERAELADVLGVPGWVAVSPAMASRMGWSVGSRVPVSSGSRRVELRVGALVDFARLSPLASSRLAVMDLSQVQGLLGRAGQVRQIDVVVEKGADVAGLARRLDAKLGPGARVLTPEARMAEADALLAAFRLNLTALSLVSLFVGGFLVYATTQAALARRREELGVLRCLGATRAQVLAVVLADALTLGLLGTALGIPLGWLAARANVSAVSATLRNLYLLEGVERVSLPPWLLAVGVALGLAGALSGAVLPALDVAREDPRALLASRRGVRPGRGVFALAAGGLLALAAAAALALGPLRGWRFSGFLLALAVVAAVPLTAPLLLRGAARLRAPARLGAMYGARELAAHLRSTGVAAGALAVSVSMLVGITVMIGSFRSTVEGWLGATLRADVYVTTPSWRRGENGATLQPSVASRLAKVTGVRAMDRLRQIFTEVNGRRISVGGFDAGLAGEGGRVQLAGGDAGAVLAKVKAGEALVSEPLARRARLQPGGTVEVAGPRGPERFRVAGVYRDFGAENGAVLVDLATLAARFGEGALTNVALYAAPGVDAEELAERVKRELSSEALSVRSNRTLRREVLGIFEQTFAVTRLLEVMSLVVAVSGIALALLVLARERSGEVALYRALGATRGQIFRLFVGHAAGIGAAGLLLGALGGAGLALVLVDLINPDWFGWTLNMHVPWGALVKEAVVLAVAALAASLYPAVRASQAPASELSRDAI